MGRKRQCLWMWDQGLQLHLHAWGKENAGQGAAPNPEWGLQRGGDGDIAGEQTTQQHPVLPPGDRNHEGKRTREQKSTPGCWVTVT